jgi:hypothetical protein
MSDKTGAGRHGGLRIRKTQAEARAFGALAVPAERRGRAHLACPAVSPPSDKCHWFRPKATEGTEPGEKHEEGPSESSTVLVFRPRGQILSLFVPLPVQILFFCADFDPMQTLGGQIPGSHTKPQSHEVRKPFPQRSSW